MTQTAKLPNFNPVPDRALQGIQGPGIAIAGPEFPGLDTPFKISGRFICSQEDYERMNRVPHRHLVLTVLRKSMYGSMLPFKDYMVFRDDVEKAGKNYSGWFSFDVWDYAKFRYEGVYYVRVSLGESLSNVVEATMPPSTVDPGVM